MTPSFSHLLLCHLLIFGMALPSSIFATPVLAQKFRTHQFSDQPSTAEQSRYVQAGVAKTRPEYSTLGERIAESPSSEAVSIPRLKDVSMATEQSSDPALVAVVPLTSAKRISIKVYKYPGLTGDYRVNADQTISIPALGRIPVHKMTPANLERVLIEKMEKITGSTAHVTVEVAEYSSVSVSGFVDKPGAIPWTPGMTVLQAQALAGGLYRPPFNRAGTSLTDFEANIFRIQRISEIKRITDELKRSLAERARAYAERENVTKIDLPKRLLELVESAQAKALIDDQTKLLLLRRKTLIVQKARLDRASALAAKEISGLSERQELLKKQIDMRSEQLRLLRSAGSRGNVRRDRLLEAESKLVDLAEKSTNIVVANAKVQSAFVALQREFDRLAEDRQLALAAQIAKLERDIARMEIELAAAKESYAALSGHRLVSKHDEKTSLKRPRIVYEVTRWKDREPRTFVCDQLTLLRPGDILIVRIQKADVPRMESQ